MNIKAQQMTFRQDVTKYKYLNFLMSGLKVICWAVIFIFKLQKAQLKRDHFARVLKAPLNATVGTHFLSHSAAIMK